jgi:hypothetical protein
MLGGGCNERLVYVELLVDGDVMLRATGVYCLFNMWCRTSLSKVSCWMCMQARAQRAWHVLFGTPACTKAVQAAFVLLTARPVVGVTSMWMISDLIGRCNRMWNQHRLELRMCGGAKHLVLARKNHAQHPLACPRI